MKKGNQSKLLTKDIMKHWEALAYKDSISDMLVNDLIYNYAKSLGIYQEKLNADVTLTVNNMTNSQKRRLLKAIRLIKL